MAKDTLDWVVTKETVRNKQHEELRKGAKPRIYVWPEGESIIENMENRRQRPYTEWKKTILPAMVEEYDLGENVKFRWSQTAGCGCGCSPGFIVEDPYWDNMLNGKDLHVTVTLA